MIHDQKDMLRKNSFKVLPSNKEKERNRFSWKQKLRLGSHFKWEVYIEFPKPNAGRFSLHVKQNRSQTPARESDAYIKFNFRKIQLK